MRAIGAAMFAMVLPAVVVSGAFVEAPPAGQVPRLVIESTDGRDLFGFYCASCHGRSGKGDGPVAPALGVAPTDLTRLTVDNAGVFPERRVRATLVGAGEPTPAHGSEAMPVWGPIFRALDPNDQRLEIRIVSLLAYLESLQVR
jgi:mono/diheme cytochrome c family protein